LLRGQREGGPRFRVSGVEIDHFARLRVLERDPADVRQFPLGGIDNRYRDQVVFLAGDFQRPPKIGVHEIGDHKDDGPARERAVDVIERLGQVRPAARGLVGQHLADQPQHMPPPFSRPDVAFGPVGKKQRADLVVVLNGAEGEDRGQFGGQFAFALLNRARAGRAARVHEDHHRHLTLFDVFFDVRDSGPCGDVPVDAPDFVAGLIFPHLVEIHPAALEDGVVLAGHEIFDEADGAHLDLADFFQPLLGDHGCLLAFSDLWNHGGH
jgi:hypothetical protein